MELVYVESAPNLFGKGQNDYDLIVIGGGSGGLACVKEAASFGREVAVLDFVKPTISGTSWGLGGTCVNVGCIPKKLMHQAGLMGTAMKDARHYGWNISDEGAEHNWSLLRENVQNHIRSLNWGYRVQLKENNINYFNAFGSFVDNRTIKIKPKKAQEMLLSAEKIVIAVGGRPKYPQVLWDNPTHLYDVALECAGFLASLKFPVTLMVRSIPLRGFDQQMASLVLDSVASHGAKILNTSEPLAVQKLENGKFRVSFRQDGRTVHTADFDTVLWAIGREPRLEELGLEKAGVRMHKSGKLIVNRFEKTNIDNIFAIGDVQYDRFELTPVAIMAGKLLARRLFGGSQELMDYSKIPTTVFTPLEYGMVGLSEESCVEQFGEENLEVFHSYYNPLEFVIPHKDEGKCYLKVICKRNHPRTILGLHFLGPNAGEVVQGFATAMRLNATIDDLHKTVGIHPTCAEEMVKVRITKRSGQKATVTGC